MFLVTVIKFPGENRVTFSDGFVLIKKNIPYTLGMYVRGNGIEDELHMFVNPEEGTNLNVINCPDKIIFTALDDKLLAISEKTEPGTLTVIKNDRCIRNRYDGKNPRLKPTKEQVSNEECIEIKKEINTRLARKKGLACYNKFKTAAKTRPIQAERIKNQVNCVPLTNVIRGIYSVIEMKDYVL